jgi:RimJ/RimL family protein N-acetyltransferase
VTGPVLTTERLELWQPAKDDMASIFDIVSHPDTGRFLGPREGRPDHFQRFSRNAGSWWLYGYGAFMLRLRGSTEVIGNCGIFHSWRGVGEDFDDKPEAGWTLRHDQVGHGLAYEAMSAALHWFAREHGPQPVVCMISPGNLASIGLAHRLGFGKLREATLPDGEPVILFTRAATPPAAKVE